VVIVQENAFAIFWFSTGKLYVVQLTAVTYAPRLS